MLPGPLTVSVEVKAEASPAMVPTEPPRLMVSGLLPVIDPLRKLLPDFMLIVLAVLTVIGFGGEMLPAVKLRMALFRVRAPVPKEAELFTWTVASVMDVA